MLLQPRRPDLEEGSEDLHDRLPLANLAAHLLDVLDVGVVGELLAIQDLVEARRREGLYELLRLVGRACEAPLYGALEAFAGGGVLGHDCACDCSCGILLSRIQSRILGESS